MSTPTPPTPKWRMRWRCWRGVLPRLLNTSGAVPVLWPGGAGRARPMGVRPRRPVGVCLRGPVCVGRDEGSSMGDYSWVHCVDDVDSMGSAVGQQVPRSARNGVPQQHARLLRLLRRCGRRCGAGSRDGLDCAYIGDGAVPADHQGRGLGSGIMRRLVESASGHKKAERDVLRCRTLKWLLAG